MRSRKYGIQPIPPSDSATRNAGNFLSTGDHNRSAAACTVFTGCRPMRTSIGASGAVTTSDDDDPMWRHTMVPSSLHADQNGSQWSLWKLGSLSLAGFSENDTAWHPLPATRRTSAAMASGSHSGGRDRGMNRPG